LKIITTTFIPLPEMRRARSSFTTMMKGVVLSLPIDSIAAIWVHLIFLMNPGPRLVDHIFRAQGLSTVRDLLLLETRMVVREWMFIVRREMIIIGMIRKKGISEVPVAQGTAQLNANVVNGRDAIARAQSIVTDVRGIIAGTNDQNMQKCTVTVIMLMTFRA